MEIIIIIECSAVKYASPALIHGKYSLYAISEKAFIITRKEANEWIRCVKERRDLIIIISKWTKAASELLDWVFQCATRLDQTVKLILATSLLLREKNRCSFLCVPACFSGAKLCITGSQYCCISHSRKSYQVCSLCWLWHSLLLWGSDISWIFHRNPWQRVLNEREIKYVIIIIPSIRILKESDSGPFFLFCSFLFPWAVFSYLTKKKNGKIDNKAVS